MAELHLQLQENEDLLIEILVRLPVKSLIQCTCVCKYWLSLIRSPEFVTKHYSTHSLKFEYDSILSVFRPGCSISIFNYQHLTFETAFKFRPAVAFDPLRFEIYHRDIITDISLVGPCNGLFLIKLSKGCQSSHQVLLLWNPATREVFKLSEIPNGSCCFFFGLGFDSVTLDYKVVGLYGYSDAGKIDNTIVWLYSLAGNSWRRLFNAYMNLTHFCYLTRINWYSDAGPSCNGRMHNWILDDDCLGGQRSLLSFDMVDEVFVETPLPPDAPTIIRGFLYRGSNNMYPSIFCVGSDSQLHVWDLQQYGPTGVWNKVLNLKFPAVRVPSYMVLQKNKEFVFSNLGTVSSYNLATQQLKSLRIPADDVILAYAESLVSIASSVRQPSPIMDHSSAETVGEQATQQMKSLRISADDNNLAYMESSVSIGISDSQPSPTLDHSSDEGHVEDQQTLSETTTIHQMQLPKEDDDSDDSSIDSAFLTPDITPFLDPHTIYIDYEKDMEFYPLRKNEVERLSKLPYCLHEINKPMIYNPCTF